ncbi:sulfite exporter TauE/SafE family protein [Methylobacillus sp. Pita1]|uniref:sulfite exporter TauE/SafE family protein n=1 Tax=Methylobacillus sp. Pita1 TaxID=3382642 RepID=UPI0038B53610
MLTLCILGAAVGMLMGLTGAGGGILAVPLLVFFAGMAVTTAAPIALTAVAVTAGIGALAGLRQGVLRYRAACVMAGVGVAMTPLGLWAAHQLNDRMLMLVFALLLLLLVATESLCQKKPHPKAERQACVLDPLTGRLRWTSRCSLSLMSAGAAAGFLSGLVGVGGGFVIVPALGRLSNLDMRAVIPTSLAVIALVSLSSLGSALLWGSLDILLALPFIVGAMLGMLVGRRLAGYLAAASLKRSFALVAAAVAVMMAVRAMS